MKKHITERALKDLLWNRRTFLKAALVGTFILLGRPAFSEELMEEKSLPEEGRLQLYNTHTEEQLDVTYRDASGKYDDEALDAINHILRCHYTEKEVDIDLGVIEYLNTVDREFGGDNLIHVISGYRSPEYNEMLRRKNRRVAKHSLHLEGRAVDIRIPGVSLKKVKRAALNLRCGGVGYYPRKGFVHLDSGRFRHW